MAASVTGGNWFDFLKQSEASAKQAGQGGGQQGQPSELQQMMQGQGSGQQSAGPEWANPSGGLAGVTGPLSGGAGGPQAQSKSNPLQALLSKIGGGGGGMGF